MLLTDKVLRKKDLKLSAGYDRGGVRLTSDLFHRIQPRGIAFKICDQAEAAHSLLIEHNILLKNSRPRCHANESHHRTENYNRREPEIHLKVCASWRILLVDVCIYVLRLFLALGRVHRV